MRYTYRARAKDGKITEGERQANQVEEVVAWLRSQNLMPIAIREAKGKEESVKGKDKTPSPRERARKGDGKSLGLMERLQRISTVSTRDKAVFFRQLATMISSGSPLGRLLISSRIRPQTNVWRMPSPKRKNFSTEATPWRWP